MLENFPGVSLAIRQGRFSALGSPDEWEISPDEAWEIRDYCEYCIRFYRENGVNQADDVYFFTQTMSRIDAMLAGGGWLWNRPTVLEQDIESGIQVTFEIG